MKSVLFPLKERSYRAVFGPIEEACFELRKIGLHKRKIFLVTTQAVWKAGHAKRIEKSLIQHGYTVVIAVLPNGEQHKNFETLQLLLKKAVEANLDRKSLVMAVGGGVTTDLAGFMAAIYMRGLSFISVPTTLLGMVDAALGGKTGVDLPEGKNLVGAFWQPKLVWIDLETLKTLPIREWKTGFAEIIKYGVIEKPGFFSWLERKIDLKPNIQSWSHDELFEAIYVSVSTKAQVVSSDEKEAPLAGGREILNFGHTFGHALESATGYSEITHGEAISIGMVLAGKISLTRKLWPENDQARMVRLFKKFKLPVDVPKLSPTQRKILREALLKDKKNIGGELRFVLPTKIGDVVVQSGIPIKLVEEIAFGR